MRCHLSKPDGVKNVFERTIILSGTHTFSEFDLWVSVAPAMRTGAHSGSDPYEPCLYVLYAPPISLQELDERLLHGVFDIGVTTKMSAADAAHHG